MYLHLGNETVIKTDDIIGIFDLDTASTKTDTKRFLSAHEKAGRMVTVGYDIPKSFVVTAKGRREMVYITTLSSSSIESRWKRQSKHL